MKKLDFNSFLKQNLRRTFYKWPPRGEALRAARIERGQYRCAICQNIFKSDEVQVDHVDAVISVDSNPATKMNWNVYIKRLFCPKEGLQILCKLGCHAAKTFLENELRRENKNKYAFGKLKDGKDSRRRDRKKK